MDWPTLKVVSLKCDAIIRRWSPSSNYQTVFPGSDLAKVLVPTVSRMNSSPISYELRRFDENLMHSKHACVHWCDYGEGMWKGECNSAIPGNLNLAGLEKDYDSEKIQNVRHGDGTEGYVRHGDVRHYGW